jgi:hypothetical protein
MAPGDSVVAEMQMGEGVGDGGGEFFLRSGAFEDSGGNEEMAPGEGDGFGDPVPIVVCDDGVRVVAAAEQGSNFRGEAFEDLLGFGAGEGGMGLAVIGGEGVADGGPFGLRLRVEGESGGEEGEGAHDGLTARARVGLRGLQWQR